MQQYFHPSAKLLLYRQVHSQGGHSGSVLHNFNSITIVKITGWSLLLGKTAISCVLAVFLGEGTWAIFGVRVRP